MNPMKRNQSRTRRNGAVKTPEEQAPQEFGPEDHALCMQLGMGQSVREALSELEPAEWPALADDLDRRAQDARTFIALKTGARPKPPKAALPKVGRGWVAVNSGPTQERELRALAFASGFNFKDFCGIAMRMAARKYSEFVGVPSYKLAYLSKAELGQLRLRSQEIYAKRRSDAGFPG